VRAATRSARLTRPSGGYDWSVYDPRIVLGLVHAYGEACRHEEHARAGILYSEIVRALDDEKAAPPESSGVDPSEAEKTAA
jgi:hypothetical protein